MSQPLPQQIVASFSCQRLRERTILQSQTKVLSDAALEATLRAEKFLHEQSQKEARISTSTTSATQNETAPPQIRSVPSEEDDIIAAAKAAAEEAHKLEAKRSPRQ